MYSVYMHINKVNGKKYIGITSKKPEERFRKNGLGYFENAHFYSAIKKYGWDEGFDHIIYATGLTKEEACNLEIELIAKYNSANKDFGYNQSLGGETSKGYRHTPESKKKMSEAHKRTFVERPIEKTREIYKRIAEAHKGKKQSPESIEKTRQAKIGKPRSEETKRKVAEGLKRYFANHKVSKETRKKLSDKAKEQWQKQKNKK